MTSSLPVTNVFRSRGYSHFRRRRPSMLRSYERAGDAQPMADVDGVRTSARCRGSGSFAGDLRHQKQVQPYARSRQCVGARRRSTSGSASSFLAAEPHAQHGTHRVGGRGRLGPRALFGAAGGVFADRFDRRALLVTLDLARAVLMAALVWVVAAGGSPGPGSRIRLCDIRPGDAVPSRVHRGDPLRGRRERERRRGKRALAFHPPNRHVPRTPASAPRSCGCSLRNGRSRSTRQRSRSPRCCSPASPASRRVTRRGPGRLVYRLVIAARAAPRASMPWFARAGTGGDDVVDLRVQRRTADLSSSCSCSSPRSPRDGCRGCRCAQRRDWGGRPACHPAHRAHRRG